ncbi:MAG: DNA helicase UvrD [Deltaproteobacteria bacterium RBG_13_43_22]|nr:MAG: DNA helicase UvrD [Deltaproteobacteria bacterium RBG_13_43_22]
MKIIADFHVHSAYSRATSKEMHLRTMAQWARLKGIHLLGTGDFTHPAYFEEIKTDLEETGQGFLKLKGDEGAAVHFILTAETSHIYTQAGKGRRVHMMIFAPTIRSVEKINLHLDRIGNVKSDGRPIFGFSAKDLVKIILDIDPECFVVPAHAWTPWFSVFGSHSGFDRLEECFEEETPHIYALETGLSSDPAMNWRWSALDRLSLISNSDAHSPAKIGREANIFDCSLSYKDIIQTIKEKDPKRFLATIEFFPEEGKYHFDGHRSCGISYSPEQTREKGYLCPICGKNLVVGVMHRVEALADRPEGYIPEGAVPALHLVPLEEILGEVYDVGVQSRRIRKEFLCLIERGGSEFRILMDLSEEELRSFMDDRLADGIMQVRRGLVQVKPGFDGVYGQVKIFRTDVPSIKPSPQLNLF